MNTFNNEIEEEKVLEPINDQNSLNTISVKKSYEGLKTEPNQINKSENLLKNNTITSNPIKDRITLNKRYINNINKKRNLKLNNLIYKS